MILIDSKAYKMLLNQIEGVIQKVVVESVNKALKEFSSDWVNSKEAMKILKIKSKTTLKKMRIKFDIKFTVSGNTILYSRNNLLAHLESNSSINQ